MKKFIENWVKSLEPRSLEQSFSEEEISWMAKHDVLALHLEDEQCFTYGAVAQKSCFLDTTFYIDPNGKLVADDPFNDANLDFDQCTQIIYLKSDFHPFLCDSPSIKIELFASDDIESLKNWSERFCLFFYMEDIRMKGFKCTKQEEDLCEQILKNWDLVYDEAGNSSLFYGIKEMTPDEIKEEFKLDIERCDIIPKTKWPAETYGEAIYYLMEDRNKHSMTSLGQKLLNASGFLDERSKRTLMIRFLIEFFA